MSTQVTKVWWDGEKLMAEPIPESEIYKEPAQQEPLAWTDEQLQMLNFLYGAGDFDGVWFDQKHPTEKGVFWWRKHLRRLFTSPPAQRKLQQQTETESVLIDGVAYIVPMEVACEILRLHLTVVAAQRKPTNEMVVAAARMLSDRQAAACNVDCGDMWKVHGNDFIEDARAALEAAHGIKA